MSRASIEELTRIGDRLSAIAAQVDDVSFSEPLTSLANAADRVGESWSHSSLGYHALVYYESFVVPPPGAHFSREWGFFGTVMGTTGTHPALPDETGDPAPLRDPRERIQLRQRPERSRVLLDSRREVAERLQ